MASLSEGPWGSHQVMPNIYVSSFSLSRKLPALHEIGITAIVNCAKEMPCNFSSDGIKYLHLNLNDQTHQDIYSGFHQAVSFISQELWGEEEKEEKEEREEKEKEKKLKGKILIHCANGSSRSGTIATAFCMFWFHLSASVAVQKLKSIRKKIDPNPGFVEQLLLWEKHLSLCSSLPRKFPPPPSFQFPSEEEDAPSSNSTIITSSSPFEHCVLSREVQRKDYRLEFSSQIVEPS
mmetsp:Transcript_2683/g.3579  ORF Transcript_2683/g.3579 Transcript_2683/m.3579 type:complete len:235 (-) Transcript_2683:24-728(-)